MDQTPPAPVEIVPPPLAPRVEAQLDALEDARDIVSRFMRRMDDIAATMPVEELKVALVEEGQMVLNVTRAGRALRQIVAMEQEIMGLREPPTSYSRGPHSNGAGGHGAGGRPGRHDFNDLNEAQDLQDFEALFDLNDDEDRHAWADLEALELYDSYEKFQDERKFDPMSFDEHDEEELDARLGQALEKYKDNPKVEDLEQRQASIRAMDAQLKAELDEWEKQDEEKWGRRRAALLKLRKTQKALARKGHGPPLPFTLPWPPDGVTPSVLFRVYPRDG